MEHRTFKDLTLFVEAMCRHGGEFVRSDDLDLRQVGFLSELDGSHFMIHVSYVQEISSLAQFLGLRTPEARNAFALRVSAHPEEVLKDLEKWQRSRVV